MGCFVALSSLAQIEVLVLGDLGQLAGLLLQLVEVVLSGGNALGVLSILSFLVAVAVAEAIDLLLVSASLFLKLLELVASCVNVLAEGV